MQDWKEDGTAGYDPRVMYSTGGPICLVQLETTYLVAIVTAERGFSFVLYLKSYVLQFFQK